VRRPNPIFAIFAWLVMPSLLSLNTCGAAPPQTDDFFVTTIAPIFQLHCLSCHGTTDPAGDFSLQNSTSFFDAGYVEPSDAGGSHLIELIKPIDGQATMPRDAEPLTSEDVAAIQKWIDQGAVWPTDFELQLPRVNDFQGWSYQPLIRPKVPTAIDPWAKSPIDQFIFKKLTEQRLAYSQPADRRTLLRRLTFDLTGLPPSLKEVAAFVADQDPLAYEKQVDRLLASKRYGERWARHWLDVAKYADTCGYDKDKLRPNAWPYRDYVIRSFNDDKPYSQFVQEQIAGDVLFPNSADGILGLGFIAAGPWDFIGHVEVPETKTDGKVARNLDRDDMVSGALNTFCSLTVQCARCHNHKFDPITQEHYYSLQSIFAAVDRAERTFDSDPLVAEKRRKLTTRLAQKIALQQQIKNDIESAGGPELAKQRTLLAKLKQDATPQYPVEFGYHSAITSQPSPSQSADQKWVEIELASKCTPTQIILHPCRDDFNGIGAGFGFPLRYKIAVADESGQWKTITPIQHQDVANPRLEPIVIQTASDRPILKVRVTATKLAERKNDYIFALAELEVIADGKNVALGGTVRSLDSVEAPVRWQKKNLVDGLWPAMTTAPIEQQIKSETARLEALITNATPSDQQKQQRELLQQVLVLNKQIIELPKPQSVYAATTDFSPEGNFKPTQGKPRDVFVLHRGDVQHPGPPIGPGVIPLAADSEWQFDSTLNESQRRAELAKWLTNREHPLAWRSIVNRIWQYHFGEGIVATPNDFGVMGAKPTHPELLDWLAVEFRDSGQSFKSLHRQIVLSNTYQQSSASHAANAKLDGSNQFLWRANRRRLSAEEIRDSILTVSGAMNLTMGGPGYYLFELEKTEHSPHFEYHKFDPTDQASHRRSIYRFIARSQPNPWMTTLDCADSSQSTAKRNETLTSIQALSLLNNRFNLTMAEEFASRLERENNDLAAQVEHAVTLVVQRLPMEFEQQELEAYAREHGLANMCRFLLNLSEFVFVD
jgi:hypothetical protein